MTAAVVVAAVAMGNTSPPVAVKAAALIARR
jgi:hypothetical protein